MRLIDADALEVFVKTVRQGIYLDKTVSDIPIKDSMLLNFQQYVHLQPTIDAVPVVRCGECKFFEPYEGEKHKGDCLELIGLESCMYEEDFCSYGERKPERSET